MAIFNKSNQKPDYSENITTISEGATFSGEIVIASMLHIDGEVHGEIKSMFTVKIGKLGIVNGNITAEKLMVAGKMVGDADCESIILMPDGEILGSLISSSFVIETGGLFEGKSARRIPNATIGVVKKFPSESTAYDYDQKNHDQKITNKNTSNLSARDTGDAKK